MAPPRFKLGPALLGLLWGTLLAAATAAAAERLGRYPVDEAQISVSGISSGAFMANQLHIAHSSRIMGAGLIAGGLYGCAVERVGRDGVRAFAGLATGPCMSAPRLLRPVDAYARQVRLFAERGWIDPPDNLARGRLYAFTGRADSVVDSETVRRGVALYETLGLPRSRIDLHDGDLPGNGAGHSWVTANYGLACDANAAPYINDCDLDQAGQMLGAIYGPLLPAAERLGGDVVAFDQAEFAPGGDPAPHGLWGVGHLYVPAACRPGVAAEPCRLHVVLHGCRQSAQVLGEVFFRNVGVNEWADTNRIVVLYPQARSVGVGDFRAPRPLDVFNTNPLGCWNWWGYAYDDRYLFKDGVQVRAIWAMVQRLAGLSND